LIEYGVGFFVERNAQEAIAFYDRKILLVKDKISKIQEIVSQKKESLRAIEMKIMSLIQRQQQ
jgi:prefoldin alpha subunit